jgi:hypothetical protein
MGVVLVAGLAVLTLAGAGPRRQGGAGATVPTEARSLVRARVASVDPTTGRIALASDGAALEAVFAPSVAAGVRPGDIVFVTLNVIGSRRAAITGSVTSIDAAHDTATLALPQGRVTVQSASVKEGDLQPGDSVLIKLDLVDVGQPLGQSH